MIADLSEDSIKEYYKTRKSGVILSKDPRFDLILEMIPEKGANVLDVGCNDGFLSQYLKRNGNTVIGIEINEELAKKAAERIKDVIIQDVEEHWKVKSQTFDIVHMGFIIEHVFDYNHLFSEANRVLKPSGELIISTPNFAYIVHRVELLIGRLPSWYKNFDHIRAWTKEWLEKNLRKHGFNPVLFRGTFVVSVPIITYLGRFFPRLSSVIICKAVKAERASLP